MTIRNHVNSYFLLEWELGSCSGPKSRDNDGFDYYKSNRIFVDRCCLPPGHHVLICHNRIGPFGWGGSSLEILGQRYCDDFVGFRVMRKISLFGNNNFPFMY